MIEGRKNLGLGPYHAGDDPGALAGSLPDDRMSLRELFAILRRRWRLIVLSMGIVMGLAFLYLVQATPRYSATTLLLVDPIGKDLLHPDGGPTFAGSSSGTGVEIEVEILRSDAVLLDLIAAQALIDDPEFGPALSLIDKARLAVGLAVSEPSGADLVNATLARVRKAVEARRRGLTDLIGLSFTSRDPKRAADLANALAARYIALQVAAKSQSFLDATRVLEGQLDAAQAALTQSDAALARYVDDNLDRLVSESDAPGVGLLQARLARASEARLSAQQAAETAGLALQTRDWSALVDALNTDALRALERQRDSLKRRLGGLAAGSDEGVDLRAGLARIEDRIAAEGAAALAGLRADVSDYTRSMDLLREDLRQELLTGDLSPETLSQLYGLQREATIAQRQYDTLLGRIRDLEAQALVQVADTRVVSPAIAPSGPSYPNTKLVLALALVGALGTGVGLALMNEFHIGGIHSGDQLANSTGMKVGAVVPEVALRQGQLSVADTVIDAPLSQFAESLRRLRASIDGSVPRPTLSGLVIMVSSALPVEGKSVTSLALARTYAGAGKRTLLIDADMRKPTIHQHLGVEPSEGLFEYLSGTKAEVTAEDCYDLDPRAPLGVIFGRDRSGAPTDVLLQSARFRALVEDARQSFDVVVIDTPPMLPLVDAQYIAPMADCTVLCTRAGETGQADVRQALEQLTDHAAADAAVVAALTFGRPHAGSYSRSGYYTT